MPIGVIVNCISVLAGGVIGSALGHVLPNSLKEHLPTLFGMCSIAIGINSIIKAVSMTAVVLAILVGFTIGHLLHLEDWASRFFHRLVKTMHLGGDNIDMEFYITAVALFCCSGFGWYSTANTIKATATTTPTRMITDCFGVKICGLSGLGYFRLS